MSLRTLLSSAVAAAIVLVAGCSPVAPGRQGAVLVPADLAATTARAESGDTDAIWMLVCHYSAHQASWDQKKARGWALRGKALGDPNCKQWLWEHFSD